MTNKRFDKTAIIDLPNEAASVLFANQLANCLKPAVILAFSGDIGAGKTTIIRAMLKRLGVSSSIKSPTFSLVESYQCDQMMVHHFDLYRIHHEEELGYIGFRDYFTNTSVSCIEWPEKAGALLPQLDIQLKLIVKGAGREMQFIASSAVGEEILVCLAGK